MDEQRLREAIKGIDDHTSWGKSGYKHWRTVKAAAERSLAVPDDAEVREAVEVALRWQKEHGLGRQRVATLGVLIAAALTPRTRWYMPEVDGPPTDTGKTCVAWFQGETKAYIWVYEAGRWVSGTISWWGLIAYTYLDPPPVEEPLDADTAWDILDAHIAQTTAGDGEEVGAALRWLRENWRKMRGHS